MDICSCEYMFASELITDVMQLYNSKWEPDIKASYGKDSPFTQTVKMTIDYIWNEKKEFVNDLFNTVLQSGTINVTNYEVPVKYASHLVTEEEYDEIELLRYCVIAAGYATLFYQKGLEDVPDRCLRFIYDTIITFKSKNEFNDESWSDIALLGGAYIKKSQSLTDLSNDESLSLIHSCKGGGPSSNFLMNVSDQNTVKITNKNNCPNTIKEFCKKVSRSATTSILTNLPEECNAKLPRTKNVKRKRTETKREVKKVEGNAYSNTAEKKAVPEEIAETKTSREVTYRSKKFTKTKNNIPKNTYTKDSFKELAYVKDASKNTGGIDALTKCEATKVKSLKDAPEKIDKIKCTTEENIVDCEKVKGNEYAIKKLNGTKLQIKKMTGTKYKSKKVKSSKHSVKEISMTKSATEKNSDDKFPSEKNRSNKDTNEKISFEVTQQEYMECVLAKICAKNKIASHEHSKTEDTEQKVQANRHKTNKVKSQKYKEKKHLAEGVADCRVVLEKIIAAKYVDKKVEKINDDSKKV